MTLTTFFSGYIDYLSFTNTSTFRENPKLSMYKKDTESERGVLFRDLEKLIKDNPLFRDKLDFPTIKTSRLRTLINHRCLRLVILFSVNTQFSQMIKTWDLLDFFIV